MANFQEEWVNWGKNIDIRPRTIFTPASIADVTNIIQQVNGEGRRLRVCGTQLSYSDVAISHDDIMDLSKMNNVLAFFTQGMTYGYNVAASSPVLGGALNYFAYSNGWLLAHVQAGITIKELFTALDSPQNDVSSNAVRRGRWALFTFGAGSAQTLAGAISTSTHGADFNLPPMADLVKAIELIDPNGNRHWIERSGQGSITDPVRIAEAFQDDPNPPAVHYDDDMFLSVLVSMGCMGVICSYVLQVTNQFGLSQRVGNATWNAVKNLIAQGTLFNSLPPWPGVVIDEHPQQIPDQYGNPQNTDPAPWALEIFINPYRLSSNYYTDPAPDRACIVVSRAFSPVFGPQQVSNDCCVWQWILSAANAAATGVSDLADVDAFDLLDATHSRPIVQNIMSSLRQDTVGFPVAWSVQDTFNGVVPPYQPVSSIEIAVPDINNNDVDFVDALLTSFDTIIAADLQAKYGGGFGIRYTQPSQAYLAMQNFTPELQTTNYMVCTVEISPLRDNTGLPDLSDPGNPGLQLIETANAVGIKNTNQLASKGLGHLIAFEGIGNNFGAHLHWGQFSFTNSHNPSQYADFDTWMNVRHNLSRMGAAAVAEARVFENDFTVRYGISGTVGSWQTVSNALLPGSPTGNPDADDTGSFPPTAYLNGEGLIEILVIGTDGNILWNMQEAADSDFIQWSYVENVDPDNAPNVLNYNFTGRIAVGFNRDDGHPEAFALNVIDGQIYHAWRKNITDNSWQSWQALSPGNVQYDSSPDVTTGTDENLVVVARRADNQIAYNVQNNKFGVIGWAGWSLLPVSPEGIIFAGDPCIGINTDGTLETFSRDANGNMWSSLQPDASGNWNDWIQVGVTAVISDPAAGRNRDGLLTLFAVIIGSQMATLTQSAVGEWSETGDWTPLPNQAPYVAQADWRPSVVPFFLDLQVGYALVTGNIVHYNENGGNWQRTFISCRSNNQAILAIGPPSLINNQDNRLELFVKTGNDLLQHRRQDQNFQW